MSHQRHVPPVSFSQPNHSPLPEQPSTLKSAIRHSGATRQAASVAAEAVAAGATKRARLTAQASESDWAGAIAAATVDVHASGGGGGGSVGDGVSEMKPADVNAARNGASPRVVYVTIFNSPLSTAVKQLVFHVK